MISIKLLPASRWLVAMLLGVMLLTCRQRDAPWVSIVPGKPNLVVLFKEGTDLKSRNRFLAEDVFDPPRPGRVGTDLRRGLHSLVLTDVGHHRGYVLGLDPTLPENEQQRIKQQMSASPLVYQVLEDVSPEQIDLKDGDPPPLPKRESRRSK
jgi:hypothetical protein